MGLLSGVQANIVVPRPAQRPWGTLVSTIPAGITVESAPTSGWPFANGLRFFGEGCGEINVDGIDCSDYSRTAVEDFGDEVDFEPFFAWISKQCAVLGGRTGAEISAAAIRRLEENIGYQLAKELYSGTVTSNPAIRRDPVVINTSAAVPVEQAMQLLDEVIASHAGNFQAYIHVPTGALEALAKNYLIDVESDTTVIYTPAGHIVIADGGYSGGDPLGASFVDENGDAITPAASADGEAYFYATGPIVWDYGPQEDLGPEDSGGTAGRTNRLTAVAQRPVVYAFNPNCLHIAVLATITS